MSPQLLYTIWLTGWRAIIANLFWPGALVLYFVLVVIFLRICYKRAPIIDESPPPWEQEPIEFTEEELQHLSALKRRIEQEEISR